VVRAFIYFSLEKQGRGVAENAQDSDLFEITELSLIYFDRIIIQM